MSIHICILREGRLLHLALTDIHMNFVTNTSLSYIIISVSTCRYPGLTEASNPLQYACYNQHIRVARCLVNEAKADVDMQVGITVVYRCIDVFMYLWGWLFWVVGG